ncbi:DUF1601 domain-containing protein [Pandoraea pulmonicola]|uniref:Protein of uncharacterized function (DUF1601) n=2 Tax=Pandoraea pulmonicola TaxID=93221 RepID=A0AAJ5D2Z2_PANPU|nr:DUF1601 domain-containing protein [Pandoraea pulmonicola]SUA93244.1 Protein of uncharacterised function (DUF1601) [Pandoraea pulmonicola]
MDNHLGRLLEQSSYLGEEALSASISEVAQCLQNNAWFGSSQRGPMMHVANKLGKFTRMPDCATGLAAIASRLNARNFQARDTSIYLNAFCKFPGDPQCTRAALSLARHIIAARGPLIDQLDLRGITNTLNALSKWPDEADARDAALCLAQHIVKLGNALLVKLDPRSIAIILNALSKWPDQATARDAVLRLAQHIVKSSNALLVEFNSYDIAYTLNGLSKWPDQADSRDAALRLARHIAGLNNAALNKFNARSIANALNALSKWPDEADARSAALSLAPHVTEMDDAVPDTFRARNTAIILNALSKWPDQATARDAALRLARHIVQQGNALVGKFNARDTSGTLNALSKWPDQAVARDAGLRLAQHIVEPDNATLETFGAQSISNALNALSKWPAEAGARDAALRLAQHIVRLNSATLDTFNTQHVTNILNALSKWPDEIDARDAALYLAQHIAKVGNALVGKFNAKEIASALNALSKWPDQANTRDASLRLAQHIVRLDDAVLDTFNVQEIPNTLNALSKWPDQTEARDNGNTQNVVDTLNARNQWPTQADVKDAALRLAQRILRLNNATLNTFDAPSIGTTLNALSKWPGQAAARDAALRLAQIIVKMDDALLGKFITQDISKTLNALSKWPDSVDTRGAALRLAQHIIEMGNASIDKFNAQDIANTLNALNKWPDQTAVQDVVLRLARHIVGLNDATLDTFEAQGIANTLDALSKWPDSADARAAALHLAQHVAGLNSATLDAFNMQHITNTLSALSKWPDQAGACAAALLLAKHLAKVGNALVATFNAQHIARALNALSKWPEQEDARDALLYLAPRVIGLNNEVPDAFDAHNASKTLNALSKWPDQEAARDATRSLARHVVRLDHAALDTFGAHDIANALNALSKWRDVDDARNAALHLARHLVSSNCAVLNTFSAQFIANTLNALSKWPDQADARNVVLHLAQGISKLNDAALGKFVAQDIANTLNALSKWPGQATARDAALRMARHIVGRNDATLDWFNAQNIANTLNALCKWPDEVDARDAALCVAQHIDKMGNALVDKFNEHNIANALNALSKWPEQAAALRSAQRLAQHIVGPNKVALDAFSVHGISSILNALSKWSDDADARSAMSCVAQHIVKTGNALVGKFGIQDITNSLNALSKWSDQEDARDAAQCLAQHIAGLNNAALDRFDAQNIANILNALSKFLSVEACGHAMWAFFEHLHSRDEPWASYRLIELGQVANAVARLAMQRADQVLPAILAELLQSMGDHVHAHNMMRDAEALQIATTIKAMAALQLHKTLATLAPSTLARLHRLLPTGLPGDNLETLGNLCAGLLPLLRNNSLSRYRTETLHVLMALHPHMARKAACFISAPQHGTPADPPTTPPESFETRCLALTFYQLLKTYNVVASLAQESQADQRRGLLVRDWVNATLTQTRETLQRDLSDMSWNLIAQIEASDDVDDAMDRFMHREHERVTQACPPTRFDPALVHRAMRGEFREVAPTVGNTRHVLVDMMGRELPCEPRGAEDYSLFARITRLPLVEVKLPGTLSRFMLARTFRYDDQLWRFDMFGGSRLTKGRHQPVEAILAGTSRGHDTLPAVPYADSAPGSALMNLVRKLAPLKEDWARMQRALLETVPHTHVGEGTLTIGWFDDVPGASHPFKPQIDGTPLALCPNDGCGFIKASVAQRIPALRERMQAWEAAPAQQRRDMSRVAPGTMAPQALQHFARDRAALDEARELMRAKLRTIDAAQIPQLQLHDLLVRGPYESMRIRAVPSADDRFHLPTQLCAGLAPGRTAPVLIGKPPYDKENLLPVAASAIATEASGDLTARFLARHFAIQYSYTGFDETSDTSDTGSMLHGKGMLIVVPDDHWPRHHHALDMACSRQDMKMHSSWTTGRKRHEIPAQMQSTGSLRVKDILLPGQCGAMPIDELRKRDMDTDGDNIFLYLDCPALAHAIDGAMQARAAQRGPTPSFKPPKTAQVAIDPNGIYRAGRAREIIDALRGHHLMGRASSAAARYLAQPNEIREQIAKAFKARLQAQLQTSAALPVELSTLIDKEGENLDMRDFLTMAAKAGTDALKSDTGITLFNRWMRSFEQAEASCKADPRRVRTIPYTKATARALRDGSFDPEKTLDELRRNPTMAAGVMQIGIEMLRPVLPSTQPK